MQPINQTLVNKPAIHVHIDLEDLWFSLRDDGKDPQMFNERSTVIKLIHHLSGYGRVVLSNVYDQWQDTGSDRTPWKTTGFNTVYVTPDKTEDSRVTMVTAVTALGEAINYRPQAVVLMAGSNNYIELVKRLRQLGVVVHLIGVDRQTPKFMTKACDSWTAIESVLGIITTTDDEVITSVDEYDFVDFAKIIKNLENGTLNFIGVKHLINNILPSEGIPHSMGYKVVSEAEQQGLLQIYKVDSGRSGFPTKACRLNPEHDITAQLLSSENLG